MISGKKSEYSYAISSANNDNYSSDSSSDENILHVVTNVYTIPLQKACTDQSGIDQLDSDITKKMNEIRINLSRPGEETYESQTARVEHRSFDTNSYSIQTDKTSESHMTKSKFQIKSIVEIYESQDESELQQGSTGLFKTSNKVNQIISEKQIPIYSVKGKPHHSTNPAINTAYGHFLHHTLLLNCLSLNPLKYHQLFFF